MMDDSKADEEVEANTIELTFEQMQDFLKEVFEEHKKASRKSLS